MDIRLDRSEHLPRVLVGMLTIWLASCSLQLALGQSTTSARPPNIVVILADDLGYSDLGCNGGEIATPNLDRLAANGLRFNQFYNTARCWPTRAAILTGYYPQQVRMDPAEDAFPTWVRTLPQRLATRGYRSYHSGKWHIKAAPRPVADGGFDRSYHLLDHDRHFNPQRHQLDDQPLPSSLLADGYYTTTAIATHAIECLREHERDYAERPFFQYVAFTVPHFPLMAPLEDIQRYAQRYRAGWDIIRRQRLERQAALGMPVVPVAPPESQIKAPSGNANTRQQLGDSEVLYAQNWDDLSAEQKEFQATKMAIHAAMVDRMDQEIGRIVDQLHTMRAWDNTLILFLSDNGASAEILVRGDGHDPAAARGSASSYLCLGPGWSTVCNTPFRRHKIWVHEGGVSTPLIAHWPEGIKNRGEWRGDVGHVIDFVPTILDLAAAEQLSQEPGAPPLPGMSLIQALQGGAAVQRDWLYFSHSGNRALRRGNYKLVSAAIDDNRWELFDLESDRGETRDLANKQPQRVDQLASLWMEIDKRFRRQSASQQSRR